MPDNPKCSRRHCSCGEDEAAKLVRRLADAMPWWVTSAGDFCWFCKQRRGVVNPGATRKEMNDSDTASHKPDCLWLAAVKWVEENPA